jgi:hypothetical protein
LTNSGLKIGGYSGVNHQAILWDVVSGKPEIA